MSSIACRESSAAMSPAHRKSVTRGLPSVRVPVLSRTTVSTFRATSRLSASFIRIPLSAPLPIPTMIAVGVASPRAHGQAMISTVTMARRPWVKPSTGSSSIHKMKESKAMAMIAGTKTAAILSTSFCTGALLPCASCTIAMIFESRVSVTSLSARNLKLPFPLIVPAKTFAPADLAAGTGSPFSVLSSTYDEPSVTVPSAAILSPGRTSTMSPALTSETGISTDFPSTITVTVSGWSPMSFLIAPDVLAFARSSISLPARIKAMITLEASKYT